MLLGGNLSPILLREILPRLRVFRITNLESLAGLGVVIRGWTSFFGLKLMGVIFRGRKLFFFTRRLL